MNQLTQGESYGGPPAQPLKRRPGRPRKNPSLKHAEGVRAPPRLEAAKEQLPLRTDNNNGNDSTVGQAVTGVVEATFDAGYLLSVTIGNSNTHLRGVVFKPGHYAPVTAENDVAPHVKMIKRNNQGFSRNQKLAAGIVTAKQNYVPPNASPVVPLVRAEGTVATVGLQTVNLQSGLPPPNQLPLNAAQTSEVSTRENKVVHQIEPVSVLPLDHSKPVDPIYATTPQPHSSHQVGEGSKVNDNGSFSECGPEAGLEDKAKTMASTEINMRGPSKISDLKTESGKEASESSSEDSGGISNEEAENSGEPFSVDAMQMSSGTEPLLNYGSGRMTELLQAVQEKYERDPGANR